MEFNDFCSAIERSKPALEFCERFDGNSEIWNFTRHNHPYIELLYFLDGRASITVSDERMQISLYDAIVYPCGMFHQEILLPGHKQEIIALWIHAPEITLESSLHISDNDGRLQWLFENIHTEYKRPDACMSLITHYIRSLLTLIMQKSSVLNNEYGIEKVIQYIQSHFSEPISVAELAEIEHCSESYLSRRFKQFTGFTVVKYINKTRIDVARQLIVTSAESIEEIAYLTGFDSPKYFCKVFKSLTSLSPREYRNAYKG